MLAAALGYAARCWPVVPLHSPSASKATGCTCSDADCTSPAKHPRTLHGLHDATTDPDVIRSWWRQWPHANVGLRTGVAFDVLDIDDPTGGQRLAQIADEAGLDTSTCWLQGPMSMTAKGTHLLYLPTGRPNRTGFVPRVDWRGSGGYIVAPPSIHASGIVYRWHENCPPDAPLGVAPAFLVALLDKPERPPSPARIGTPLRASSGPSGWSPSGLIASLATAVEGTRNDVLHWAACKVGSDEREHKASNAAALDALEQLATVAERIGLGTTEIDKTIRSGYTAGLNGKAAA